MNLAATDTRRESRWQRWRAWLWVRRLPLLALGLPMLVCLVALVVINHDLPRLEVWEWGDWGPLGMDTLRAKHFHQFTGFYSSRMVRHPGPLQAYWQALFEFLLVDVCHWHSTNAADLVATAVFNLLWLFALMWLVWAQLRRKLFMVPAYLWVFGIHHQVLWNHLSYQAPHNMSVFVLPAFVFSAALVIAGEVHLLPLWALGAVALAHLHSFNAAHVAFVGCLVGVSLLYRLRSNRSVWTEWSRPFALTALVIALGVAPLLYDQFFGTGNLTKIAAYLNGAGGRIKPANLGALLGRDALYLPAFFASLFWKKTATYELAATFRFQVGVFAASLYWLGTGAFLALTFLFSRRLLLRWSGGFVVLGMLLCGQFAIVGDSIGWEVYARNLYGYLIIASLAVILFLDEQTQSRKSLRSAALLGLCALPVLCFPDARGFFRGPGSWAVGEKQLERGFFDLHHGQGTDSRMNAMASTITRSGLPAVLWLDDPSDWPYLYGYAFRLFNQRYPVCIADPQRWGNVGTMMGAETVCATLPERRIDVHLTRSFFPFGDVLYHNVQTLVGVERFPGDAAGAPTPSTNFAPFPHAKAWQRAAEGRAQLPLVVRDANGVGDIRSAYVLVNDHLGPEKACLARYDAAERQWWLADAGQWRGPLVAGSRGELVSPTCSIVDPPQAVAAAQELRFVLPLRFAPALIGVRSTHLLAIDRLGAQSNWRDGPPISDRTEPPSKGGISLEPHTGAGGQQEFVLTVAGPDGYANVQFLQFLVADRLDGRGACLVQYVPAWRAVQVYEDWAGAFGRAMGLGTAETRAGSQCVLDGRGVMAEFAVNRLTLRLPLTFAPSFRGRHALFALVHEQGAEDVRWQTLGSWEVR